MPVLPLEARRLLAERWPEYVRQLIQYLSRLLTRKQVPLLICSVTEIQPKRLEEYGESYLHLHLLWGNHPGRCGNWAISANQVRAWSEGFLRREGILGDEGWVRVNVQPIKKTASGYMAKYMSKGPEHIGAMADELGWDAIPRAWYNLSGALRKMVQDALIEGVECGAFLMATIEGIFSGVVPFSDVFYCLHEVMMDIGGSPRGVGWRGACTEALRKDALTTVPSVC